tara:strand:- start:764 stop:1573 length:810 start_codon:yes stop_codon:yes gene_type:complete
MDLTKSLDFIKKELINNKDFNTSYLLGSSAKIELSNKSKTKYISKILYMSAASRSGINMCPFSTKTCRDVCLGHTSGHAAMTKNGDKTNLVEVARLKRSLLYIHDRENFLKKLKNEVKNLVKYSKERGLKPVVRLNGTTDLPVETWGVFKEFPRVKFYDYTKSKSRMIQFLNGKFPKNYYLVYSYSPENKQVASEILALGGNVACVFDEKKSKKRKLSYIGKRFLGHTIIDGDSHDLRFLDKQGGYVVGLSKKGKIKNNPFFISLKEVK